MDFNEKYQIDRENLIGQGLTSEVYRGINRYTNEYVAIKIIKKKKPHKYFIQNEIENLKTLSGHPNIIKLLDSYEFDLEFILVFEYIELTLKNYIKLNKNNLSTNIIKHIIKQLISISELLYKYKIIHHDIKSENILVKLETNNILPQIILCDFGFSISSTQIPHRKLCGSPIYMHPTKLLYNFNFNSDEWSMNVIFYELVYGIHPFKGITTKTELVNSIYKNHISFPYETIFTPQLKKLFLTGGNVFISVLKKEIEQIEQIEQIEDDIEDDYVIL